MKEVSSLLTFSSREERWVKGIARGSQAMIRWSKVSVWEWLLGSV